MSDPPPLIRGASAWLGYAASVLEAMTPEARRELVSRLVDVEPCVPRVVWSACRVGGTGMRVVFVEVFDEHGSWSFESHDEEVEYANNCVGGLDALVVWCAAP